MSAGLIIGVNFHSEIPKDEMVWRRPENSSNVIIPHATHLISHDAPKDLGTYFIIGGACKTRGADTCVSLRAAGIPQQELRCYTLPGQTVGMSSMTFRKPGYIVLLAT